MPEHRYLADWTLEIVDKSFLQYYLRELSVLEDDCAAFASAYPQVAANLGLEGSGSADPHIRQLIESVAFIAARLKRQIDSLPGELAINILRSVAPSLTVPVPSMSVVRLIPKSEQLTEVSLAPDTVRLVASTKTEEVCFTGYTNSATLWPLSLECIHSSDPTLSTRAQQPSERGEFIVKISHSKSIIEQGKPGELIFFISGSLNRALQAIDGFALGVESIRMEALDGSWAIPVKRENLKILGFDDEHRMLGQAWGSGSADDIASDFLNYPRRFCFFKLSGLYCPRPSRGFILAFSVRRDWLRALEAIRGHLLLNCFPVINLYSRPPTALRLNGGLEEYLISRDDTGNSKWDAFGIRQVDLVDQTSRYQVPEVQAVDAGTYRNSGKIFWQGVRRERTANNMGHASLALRFVGLQDARSKGLKAEMAFVQIDCTNCDAPELLEARHSLSFQGWDCPYEPRLELSPSTYVPSILSTDSIIVDMLRVLQAREGRLQCLEESITKILSVYNRSKSPHALYSISSISRIQKELVSMPWPNAPLGAMLGLGHKYKILYNDDDNFVGSRYIFSRVIAQILRQMLNSTLPSEVVASDGRGGIFYVP